MPRFRFIERLPLAFPNAIGQWCLIECQYDEADGHHYLGVQLPDKKKYWLRVFINCESSDVESKLYETGFEPMVGPEIFPCLVKLGHVEAVK